MKNWTESAALETKERGKTWMQPYSRFEDAMLFPSIIADAECVLPALVCGSDCSCCCCLDEQLRQSLELLCLDLDRDLAANGLMGTNGSSGGPRGRWRPDNC